MKGDDRVAKSNRLSIVEICSSTWKGNSIEVNPPHKSRESLDMTGPLELRMMRQTSSRTNIAFPCTAEQAMWKLPNEPYDRRGVEILRRIDGACWLY